MTRVELDCITMSGNDYVLVRREGRTQFPHGEVGPGEHPAEAVKRVVAEWTGTKNPKLEVVDFLPRGEAMSIVFRAMLVEAPQGDFVTAKRMELPEDIGRLSGKWVEESLKTSLAYKLTRG